MKTIVENDSNLSKYLFEDDKEVDMLPNQINVGDPANLDFIVGDLNSGNSSLYENVTDAPADWAGNKYTYDGTTWTQDPNWVDPNAE
jgi:hypothetical protein